MYNQIYLFSPKTVLQYFYICCSLLFIYQFKLSVIIIIGIRSRVNGCMRVLCYFEMLIQRFWLHCTINEVSVNQLKGALYHKPVSGYLYS